MSRRLRVAELVAQDGAEHVETDEEEDGWF